MQSISVITVCFNSELHIEDCMKSVLKAYDSFNNFNLEVVFIDGKSTDNTVEKILSYKREFLSNNIKFKLISEKDKGLYDAMNKGVKNSNFDWIWFLNSDDYLVKDAFNQVVPFLSDNPQSDLVYGAMIKQGKGTEYTVRERDLNSSTKSVTFNHPSTMVKRVVFDQFGCFDIKYKMCADYDFFVRISRKRLNFIYLNQVLTVMREGGVSDKLSNYFYRGIEHFEIDKFNYSIKTAIINNFSYFFIGLPKKIMKEILLALRLDKLVQLFYNFKYSK